MKEWKTMLFILALVASLSEGVGAAELKGRITDSEGSPIDYASVRVMSADSLLTGAVCDEAGEYSFDNLAASTVIVTASSIGYESASQTVTLSDITPATVNLSLNVKAAVLGEVTVTADRFMRTRQGLTVIPSKNQTAHSSSGFELLRNLMIPGVTVNTLKGTVTALGGNTTLYIDGQTADLREIMQLRPDDVERVVFIDAPSGRYAGDNTAVNFIMKKRESGGYVGLDATQRVGYTSGDYNLSMKYYRRNTQYILFAGTDYSSISGAETERNELISFPEGDISRHYSTTADSERKNSQYVWMRVRNKNDKRTLRATLNIVRNRTPRSFNASELTYSGLAALDGTTIAADRLEKSRSMKYSLGLSGTITPGNSQTIDASVSASLSDTGYDYIYTEQGQGVSSSTAENLVGLNASLSYVKTFSRGNSLTAKIIELCNISSADYSGSNSSRQNLSLSESLLFVEYMHPICRIASVRVSSGVSLQAYRLSGYDAVVKSAPRAQAIFTIQPSQKQYIQLGAVLGNSYPQLSMLTGATTAVDIIHVKRGNPELPQTRIVNGMAVYAAGIEKVNLQAKMQYNYASSLPTTQYFIEESRLIQTFRGDGIWHMLSPTLSATWIPDSRFNLQISAGWLYNRYITPAVLTSSCITAEANLSWYVGSFAINAHLTAPGKVLGYELVEVKTLWSYGLSANWSKGNLKIEAGLSNPLSFHPETRETTSDKVYRFNTARYTPADRCSGYVKASWSIDFGKKTGHEQRNIDKTIDSGILRAR